MKKVKNVSALNELALKSGSVVVGANGKVFNASKKKAVTQKRLEPRNEPSEQKQPEPVETPASNDSEAILSLSKNVSEAARANLMMIAELKTAIVQQQSQVSEPILDWDFEMIRDDKGYLVRIKAHAEIVKPTLN